jgi:dTDP-glucose 4,6-dehydratase
MRILVTGGCGFIGSNFIRYILQHYKPAFVTNVDVLTYAGNPANLDGVVEEHGERYEFFKADIANADQMDALMTEHRFYALINFAAGIARRSEHQRSSELHSHERDRHERTAGLCAPATASNASVKSQPDEVYGSLGPRLANSPSNPRSIPVRRIQQAKPARPSGPRLFQDLRPRGAGDPLLEQLRPLSVPEKLIPLMIIKALRDEPLPVYGDGMNCAGLDPCRRSLRRHCRRAFRGKTGQIYNFGGDSEMANIDLVKMILDQAG